MSASARRTSKSVPEALECSHTVAMILMLTG
jgi:hypothetical protein